MALDFNLSIDPAIFVGTKPAAVLIDGEILPAHTWRKVYKEILQHCIKDPVYYERLMNLRGRIAGQQRVFISDKSDGMTQPLQICEGLYGEVHYGSQTLMHILTVRILTPLHYDYSKIKIRISQISRRK